MGASADGRRVCAWTGHPAWARSSLLSSRSPPRAAGPLSGALLLLAYSLGLGVPFLLAGLFFVRTLGALAWVKRHFAVVKIASGALLVVYGLLLVTGRFTWLSSQLSGYRLFDF